jgi:hypothetical protein
VAAELRAVMLSLGSQRAEVVGLWRAWRALADDEDSELEALGQAWQQFAAAMDLLAEGQ